MNLTVTILLITSIGIREEFQIGTVQHAECGDRRLETGSLMSQELQLASPSNDEIRVSEVICHH